jgi:hypothetical protein
MKRILWMRVLGVGAVALGLVGISNDARALTFTGQINLSAHAFSMIDPGAASCISMHTDSIGVGNSCSIYETIHADIPFQYIPDTTSLTAFIDGVNDNNSPTTYCTIWGVYPDGTTAGAVSVTNPHNGAWETSSTLHFAQWTYVHIYCSMPANLKARIYGVTLQPL